MNATLLRTWRPVLTGVVALLYAWVGLSADGSSRILGVAGAVAIVGALVAARRSGRVAAARVAAELAMLCMMAPARGVSASGAAAADGGIRRPPPCAALSP